MKITRNDIYVRSEKGADWFNEFLQSFAETKESSYQDLLDAINYKKSETVQGVVEEYRKMVGLDSIGASENKINSKASIKRPLYEEHADLTKIEDEFERPNYGEMLDALPDSATRDDVAEFLLTKDDWLTQQDEALQDEIIDEAYGVISIMKKMDRRKRERRSNYHPLSIRHAMPLEVEDVVSAISKDPNLMEDIRSLCEHSGGTKNTHSIIRHLREKLGKQLVSYSDSDLIEYIEKAKKEYQSEKEEKSTDIGRVGTDTEDHPEDNDADYITHGKGS